MKTTKRFVSVILSLCLLLTTLGVVASANESDKTYTLKATDYDYYTGQESTPAIAGTANMNPSGGLSSISFNNVSLPRGRYEVSINVAADNFAYIMLSVDGTSGISAKIDATPDSELADVTLGCIDVYQDCDPHTVLFEIFKRQSWRINLNTITFKYVEALPADAYALCLEAEASNSTAEPVSLLKGDLDAMAVPANVNEYLEYTVVTVPKTGVYNLEGKLTTGNAASSAKIYVDDAHINTVAFTSPYGEYHNQNFSYLHEFGSFYLTAGTHKIKVMTASTGGSTTPLYYDYFILSGVDEADVNYAKTITATEYTSCTGTEGTTPAISGTANMNPDGALSSITFDNVGLPRGKYKVTANVGADNLAYVMLSVDGISGVSAKISATENSELADVELGTIDVYEDGNDHTVVFEIFKRASWRCNLKSLTFTLVEKLPEDAVGMCFEAEDCTITTASVAVANLLKGNTNAKYQPLKTNEQMEFSSVTVDEAGMYTLSGKVSVSNKDTIAEVYVNDELVTTKAFTSPYGEYWLQNIAFVEDFGKFYFKKGENKIKIVTKSTGSSTNPMYYDYFSLTGVEKVEIVNDTGVIKAVEYDSYTGQISNSAISDTANMSPTTGFTSLTFENIVLKRGKYQVTVNVAADNLVYAMIDIDGTSGLSKEIKATPDSALADVDFGTINIYEDGKHTVMFEIFKRASWKCFLNTISFTLVEELPDDAFGLGFEAEDCDTTTSSVPVSNLLQGNTNAKAMPLKTNEQMEFTSITVPKSGMYTLRGKVSAGNKDSIAHVFVDDECVSATVFTTPYTEYHLQNFSFIQEYGTFYLSAGTHKLKIMTAATGSSVNPVYYDYFNLTGPDAVPEDFSFSVSGKDLIKSTDSAGTHIDTYESFGSYMIFRPSYAYMYTLDVPSAGKYAVSVSGESLIDIPLVFTLAGKESVSAIFPASNTTGEWKLSATTQSVGVTLNFPEAGKYNLYVESMLSNIMIDKYIFTRVGNADSEDKFIKVQATDYNPVQGEGFYEVTPEYDMSWCNALNRTDGVEIEAVTTGLMGDYTDESATKNYCLRIGDEEWYTYTFTAPRSGYYNVGIRFGTQADYTTQTFKVSANGDREVSATAVCETPNSAANALHYDTDICSVYLKEGTNTVKIAGDDVGANIIDYFTFTIANDFAIYSTSNTETALTSLQNGSLNAVWKTDLTAGKSVIVMAAIYNKNGAMVSVTDYSAQVAEDGTITMPVTLNLDNVANYRVKFFVLNDYTTLAPCTNAQSY